MTFYYELTAFSHEYARFVEIGNYKTTYGISFVKEQLSIVPSEGFLINQSKLKNLSGVRRGLHEKDITKVSL